MKYLQEKPVVKDPDNIQKEIQDLDAGSIVDITKKKIIHDIMKNENGDNTTFTGIIHFIVL